MKKVLAGIGILKFDVLGACGHGESAEDEMKNGRSAAICGARIIG